MISPSLLSQAVDALTQGKLVGLPTETVYGLGADATNPGAVAVIFDAKGRPRFNPLISHVASLEAAQLEGEFSPLALKLAQTFWPGPLTLVVPRKATGAVCDLACAGLPTIALRVPAHEVALETLRAFGKPIAAPSANKSGRPSPTTAKHVLEEFAGALDLVLDGGPSKVGLESSVVAVMEDRATLLRLGGLSRADIESVTGRLLEPTVQDHAAPASPGMILRHYAPNARVLINQTRRPPSGVYIGFGPHGDDPHFNLSPSGSVIEAAGNLFAMLRAADALSPQVIAVAPIPNDGLGEAINDRLSRAAEG
jgi:L-threonylcarbamoyladenylate synthase